MLTRSSGLLAACDDPRGFGLPLWPFQRRLLGSVEKGPRLHVVAAGRRSGKSTSAALVLLWDALLRPHLAAKVRPGERRYSVAVATNLRQARLIVAAARAIVERSPALKGLVENATDDELLFANGTALTAFPCTSRGGRGWPISALVLDEAAHMVDTDGNSAAESVWRALVPSTAQFGDEGRVIVSSTPWGQDGLFASLHAQATSGELLDAVAHHASTADANPTITPEFLAAEEARDPEGFKSEYLAEFVGGGAAFLDPERIADAVTLPAELSPEQATGWVAGIDPAFSSDPFGLAIVGRDRADPHRLVLGVAHAWKPPKKKALAFEERRRVEDAVLAEVAAVCKRYGAHVVTDQYAAQPVVDFLRRRGLQVRTHSMSATSKSAVFAELRARLNAGRLDLYHHGDLLAELRRLRTRYAAGAASVVNPRRGGSHGDLAQALALATFEHARLGLGDARGELHVLGRSIGDELGGGVRDPWDTSGALVSGLSYGMKF
ncbi:MAG TPA: hypothetical protein VNI55_01910 [Gaiellaceae bacterium]|nr:hypothetical protein [Gaiellaceae bacterium]